MTLDAHQHFWHFDPVRDKWMTEGAMSAIRRDFLPEDLAPILTKNGFDGCIAVQADQSEKETQFLLELADKHDFIKGVVGWVDLKANNLEERLDYFSQFPKLKGFRHILQSEKSIFMLTPKFTEGVRLLGKKDFTYDILVYPNQLKPLLKFIKNIDNQPLVIDHIAKPYIKDGLIKEWAKDMRVIARRKNVFCKISGMVTEADWKNWKESDFTAYLDVIFEAYGTDRIMYGSDWPVCLLAADYEKQLAIIQNYMSNFPKNSQNTEGVADAENSPKSHIIKPIYIDSAKIFGENAARFYKI